MAGPTPIVPTDNVAGVTPGKLDGGAFGVTPDGAGSLTLSLWVPAGRLGVQPELDLHYHSRGGNGPLGVGWSLSGLPRITRRRRTIPDEGADGPIRYDSTDPFALDGEPLVLVGGTHGADGAEYRTKRDTFTKIVLHDVDTAPDGRPLGPTWFEAFQKDGRILTFGGLGREDLGSRFEGLAQVVTPVQVPEGTLPAAVRDAVAVSQQLVRYGWGLRSIRDRSGNELRITYQGYPFRPDLPPPERDFVPVRIQYTGSRGGGVPALRSVDFGWEPRPDPETRLLSGLPVTQHTRLRELRMSGPDPTAADPSNVALLRRYLFAYRNTSVSGRSLLAGVQELDGAGIALGGHTFDWELGGSGFQEIATGITDIKTTPAGRSTLPGRIRVADFDGDGRDDILYVPRSDPDHFAILRSDPASPTGFLDPYYTDIPVPADNADGRVYVYPDPAGDFMNIFVLDDSAQPGTAGSPTYRVHHAGIDRSGASGSIGSFWVFRGRDVFNPAGSVDGPVEVADLDGDGLPDLVHGFTGGGGVDPNWYLRANLGGNLNFDVEQPLGTYPFPHLTVSPDGGSATALLVDDSGTTGGDPRWSAVGVTRQAGQVSTTVALGTLPRGQDYLFGDFTRSGLPSAFSLGGAPGPAPAAVSDPTLTENLGGTFGQAVPVALQLPQPPSKFTPALRVIDWNEDGHATVLVRTRTAEELGDPMYVLRWNGQGFSQIQLPFTSSWDQQFPEGFDLCEVIDHNGDGLDGVVMYSDGQLRLFVRGGNRADLLTGITDGLGAHTAIGYRPISDPAVHTPQYGFTFPLRASTGKIWVVAEYREDNGVGGVNTHRYTYAGGVQDVTGAGFLGFRRRTAVHVETGVSTVSDYLPDLAPAAGSYPLLGLPVKEVTTTPLGHGLQHRASITTSYTERPGPAGTVPYFVVPIGIDEEQVVTRNGVPTMPVRRCTTAQDMDAYGNLTVRSQTWSDGNALAVKSAYSNDPVSWLIGLCTEVTERSTSPNGSAQIRRFGYEYGSDGLLTRETVEPGVLGPDGWLPIGPQPDGVRTLYRTLERYPDGNLLRVTLEESIGPGGAKRSVQVQYDGLEHQFPVQITDGLGHTVSATHHPGLGVQISSTDQNGVQTFRQYDGFGRLRGELAPDGTRTLAHHLDVGGRARISVLAGSGEEALFDHDELGRVVTRTLFARDDGKAVIRDTEYDALGRAVRQSLPHFAADAPSWDTFTYDTLGRITARTGADGTSAGYEYRGEWLIATDGEHNATATRTDCLERPVFVTDRDAALVGTATAPAGMTVDYAPFGQVASVTDIAGNVTRYEADRLGRLISETDPDRGHLTYAYNVFGDPLRDIQADGHAVGYEYDPAGRPTAIRDALDGDVTIDWDVGATGQVTRIAAPQSAVTVVFGYDAIGRPVTKTCSVGPNRYTLTHEYDAMGRLSAIVYPKAGNLQPFELRYEYGKFGQLLRAVDAADRRVYWQWVNADASGLFGDDALGNGLTDRRIEDGARPGVLQRIQTLDGAKQLLRDTRYRFDANLNLVGRTDSVGRTKEAFGYDNRRRLRRWTWRGDPGDRKVRWDYDDIGDITLRAIEAGPGTDLAYTYNPAVAGPHAVVATTLGAYTYDARGNQTGAPGRAVRYGRGNLPTRITQSGPKQPRAVELRYDGEGSRVQTVDRLSGLATDSLDGLYEYRRPIGTKRPDGQHIFDIVVPGRLVARRTWVLAAGARTADRVEYLHADHQQSIDLVTTSHGKVLHRYAYDPFGRRTDPTDPALPLAEHDTPLHTGYTGQRHVDGWYLIDMHGRFYDPVTGRFLSADPLTPNPLNPQSWNRYAYVVNNPLSLRDPTGFDDEPPDEDRTPPPTPPPPTPPPAQPTTGTAPRQPVYRSVVIGHRRPPEPGRAAAGAGSRPPAGPTAAVPPGSGPPTPGPVTPPPSPPRNDDGSGGAAQVGLPPNAGVATGNRSHAGRPQRDPAELLLRWADRPVTAYSATPFGSRQRNVPLIGVGSVLAGVTGAGLAALGLGAVVAAGTAAGAASAPGGTAAAGASAGGVLQQSAETWLNLDRIVTALKMELHHLLPTQFLRVFQAAGINTQLYCIRIPHLLHVWLHSQWNALWAAFILEHGGAPSAEEIGYFLGDLLERFELEGFEFLDYTRHIM
ncbi:RHS repeat-associated core domain-containing protein [Kitasatospora sp. NPDC048407]|uniref:RHS repeat-associated core domain-containing protein n=1 Tax=Kitasatospora sp. NPDC048407 TaxID=3364051 RepID=UPI0037240E5E